MKSSKKANKQRRALFKAPLHKRRKQFNARLDYMLQDEYNIKRLPLRVDDHVRVVKGQFRDFEGKILRIDQKNYKIVLEEVSREKADGSVHYYPIHPSKVIITKLGVIDKWRQGIIDRRNRDLYFAEVEAKAAPGKGKKGK